MNKQSYIKYKILNKQLCIQDNKLILLSNYKNIFLKKIINVFQKTYRNHKGMGFGDFLRGSFYLLQISLILNLEFDIDYKNHMISSFIYKNEEINNIQIDYNNIFFFMGYLNTNDVNSTNKFIKYINSVNEENYYFYTNSRELFQISTSEIDFMKKRLIPNELLKISINETMNRLNLIEKQFNIIHIRTGDRFILLNDTDISLFKKIENLIISKINNNDKYFLLSDSNELKKFLNNKHSNIVINLNEIIHTGEEHNITLEDEYIATRNTLVDFFIMSMANKIFNMSVYGHKSGFSEYCSIIFNIDYEFTLIIP